MAGYDLNMLYFGGARAAVAERRFKKQPAEGFGHLKVIVSKK